MNSLSRFFLSTFLISTLTGCQFEGNTESPVPLGLSVRDMADKKQAALAPCPPTPNCVTSYLHPNQLDHQTLPSIPFSGDKQKMRDRVLKQLLLDNANIERQEDAYLYATYTSKLFGFVDDVEFYFPNDKEVHFRSASRVGKYDFGMNKKRVELIRARLNQESGADEEVSTRD